MIIMTILEVLPQVVPGQSVLEKSVLGIMVLLMMAVTGFIYKQMSNAQERRAAEYVEDKKLSAEHHKQLMDIMEKKLFEAEKDRDGVYNNYLEHFKTSEQSLLQIITKNTDIAIKLNETFVKLIITLDKFNDK